MYLYLSSGTYMYMYLLCQLPQQFEDQLLAWIENLTAAELTTCSVHYWILRVITTLNTTRGAYWVAWIQKQQQKKSSPEGNDDPSYICQSEKFNNKHIHCKTGIIYNFIHPQCACVTRVGGVMRFYMSVTPFLASIWWQSLLKGYT